MGNNLLVTPSNYQGSEIKKQIEGFVRQCFGLFFVGRGHGTFDERTRVVLFMYS